MADKGEGLGAFIRNQRERTRLSLRKLAERAQISNPYLSQVERGLYQPSAEVLKNLARALGIAPESLFARAGLLDREPDGEGPGVEEAIRLDARLSADQKEALLRVYRGFLAVSEPALDEGEALP